MIPFVLMILGLSYIFPFECISLRRLGVFYIVLIVVVITYRLTFRYILEYYRKNGKNVRKVVLVGSHENMQELYHSMTDDPTSGYRVEGYLRMLRRTVILITSFIWGNPERRLDI